MSESSKLIENTCPVCSKPYDGIFCTACTTDESEQDSVIKAPGGGLPEKQDTAYLVDLVSNRKIPVSIPRCKAGRDDLNDIVISGDQSISRFHFVVTKEKDQYFVQDNKSRHGTFLNGNQITAVEPINDGDVLKVGVSLFWFVIESPAVSEPGAEPMPVDLSERPTGLPLVSAKDLPLQGELRMSTAGERSRRGPDPNLTATSTNIPVLSPDSTLAEYLGIKPPKTVEASQEAQSETLSPSQFAARLIESDRTEAKEPTKPTQQTDVSSTAKVAEPADIPSIPLTSEMLISALQNEEMNSKEAPAIKKSRPSSLAGVASSAAIEETVNIPSATIEKLANIIEEKSSRSDVASDRSDSDTNPVHHGQGKASGNGAKSIVSMVNEITPGTVPEWCNKYFAGEIDQMSRELTDLNEQIHLTQQRIRDVENRISQLKGLRNTLLTAEGDDLIEACGKVLIFLGWRVKISDDDRQELKLEADERLSIARVIWTAGQAERTHLGQLSISQTRYWCEIGAEPKGILIVNRLSDQPPAPLNQLDYNSELADYASHKNVCLMTTSQLLALYRDVTVNNVNPETLRQAVVSASGWLQGFNLDATTSSGQPEGGSNKFSSLLSAP